MLILLELAHRELHTVDYHRQYNSLKRHLKEIGPPLKIRDKAYDPSIGLALNIVFDFEEQTKHRIFY
jgi:hypothetical protein